MLTPERIQECRESIFEGLEDGNGEDLNPLLNEILDLALRGLKADEDKARLDHLEKMGPVLSVCKMPYYENEGEFVAQSPGWGSLEWMVRSNKDGATQSGKTLRGAIDSSMSAVDPAKEFFFAPQTEVCPYCETVIAKPLPAPPAMKEKL